jgi:hypothetical protein
MAKQTINVGTTANDRSGDPLRTSFIKVNENFTELYTNVVMLTSAVVTDISGLTDTEGLLFSGNYDDLANTPFIATDISALTDNQSLLFSGNYDDLVNTPSIPSDISDLSDTSDLLTTKNHIELTGTFEGSNTVIDFEKLPNTDSNTVFDEISEFISITRDVGGIGGAGGGIYNRILETAWDPAISPLFTLWNDAGWADLSDIEARYYQPFRQTLKNNIGSNVVGKELIMKDTLSNEYYKIKFSSWAQGPAHTGAFAYTREKIDTTISTGITFYDGSKLPKAPDTRVIFEQAYIGDYGDHIFNITEAGRQVYAYNNILEIPSFATQNFKLGDTIQIITGEVGSTLKPKVNNDVEIPDATLYIQGGSNAVTSFLIPARSMAFLTKTGDNSWQLSVGIISSSNTEITNTLSHLELTNQLVIVQPAILGTPVNFTRTASGSQTDSIDTDLTLARGVNGALYNAEIEEEYDNITHDSPAGTEWNSDGWGTLLGLHTRTYGNLRSVLNNQIGNNIIGAELIMHDTINDKYYKFSFTDWGVNNGGSFAYTRILITDPNYFIKSDNNDDIDIILADTVGITSANTQGIYNSFTEEAWDQSVSPEGTLWNRDGYNDLTNVETRIYTTFYEAVGEFLSENIVNEDLVMYVSASEKYYRVKFTQWNETNGEFAYTRNEINVTEPKEGIEFADGTKQTTAYVPTNIISTATGNRRIEEAIGYNEVSVTEKITNDYSAELSRTTNINFEIFVTRTFELQQIIAPIWNGDVNAEFEISLDGGVTYTSAFLVSLQETEIWFNNNSNVPIPQVAGDEIIIRIISGADPQIWWNKSELPSGGNNFRGAVIDYHAYTGEATWIGTIHIVDDDGDENIAHTEVSSGSTDSENDDLWVVDNEGTIKYRRIDGESKTLKIHWTAKVFYGSETYD